MDKAWYRKGRGRMFAQRRKDNRIFDQIESDDNEIKVSGNSLGLSNPDSSGEA